MWESPLSGTCLEATTKWVDKTLSAMDRPEYFICGQPVYEGIYTVSSPQSQWTKLEFHIHLGQVISP